MSSDRAVVSEIEASPSTGRAGFRLHRLEVFNWGTFHRQIWALEPLGDNALLTGDIGSGKSTLVDAVTTLLVPPQKLAYNKAADAERLERSLRTYVLGHYKKERSDDGHAARPVPLRDHNTYSVVLGRFYNEGFGKHVTLAQVFWWKSANTGTQPERLFLVADQPLSIAQHFAGFGTEIKGLRKRLEKLGEVFETFPPYSLAFRNRFGIDNQQALDLFHQTVSMKSVGNLTDFVRHHMLEPFDVDARIERLIGHFDDLNHAHEAVLKARTQIDRLTPIVEDCGPLADLTAEVEHLRACREALHGWFVERKRELLVARIADLSAELALLEAKLQALEAKLVKARADRDEVKQAIAANGGDRIDRLKQEIEELQAQREARRGRSGKYDALARSVDLPPATDDETFLSNRARITAARARVQEQDARIDNDRMEASVEFARLRERHEELQTELRSLRLRRSNIPAHNLVLRERLCRELRIDAADLPFAGELIQVLPEQSRWEGAAERLLGGFGLAILVADAHYSRVATWVDRTHLGARISYFRAREPRTILRSALGERSLVGKLAVKPDSPFYPWLEAELVRRFDYACCESLEELRREARGITLAGQIKHADERHVKDDRHRIDDRRQYILGWSNEAKVKVLEAETLRLEAAIRDGAGKLSQLQERQTALRKQLAALQELAFFERFADLDWRPLDREIERLDQERAQLESESDVLRSLQGRLDELDAILRKADADRTARQEERGGIRSRLSQAEQDERACAAQLGALAPDTRALFGAVAQMWPEVPGDPTLTVESCEGRESAMRKHLQKKVEGVDDRIRSLRERIVRQMQAYSQAYPVETREVDVGVEAAADYAVMLARLRNDDLPRFEQRFKELLNVNTIREVANFQAQLRNEGQTIKERIEIINGSLKQIDYNPGRYIKLEALPETDREIREFREELKSCTEGALSGSEDEAYSEAKFLQVKQIIERFRGREGTVESDRRWTRKVTDVRNWFTFAAAEKWKEDDRDHEHYADSAGKSGGQKEKLAYTVLAASLAYQFGLEPLDSGQARSRSFRFVVIDEAFGRGSDDSAQYGLELFKRLNLQLLIVTPLQKIHIIEPFVEAVGFVHNEDGQSSRVRNLTIEDYRAERAARESLARE